MNIAARDLLGKVIERVRTANLPQIAYFIELLHRAVDIEGVESVFQRILQRDDEMALDHLMEIRYGMLFKSSGFSAQFEPTGSKGPDLLVKRDGVSAFVEVKRYRPKEGECIPETWGPHETLPQYGDPATAQERIANDLLSKLRQIEARGGVAHGILALWSDREYFEDVEFECAVRQISDEAAGKGLQFCIFGSNYVSAGLNQRFSCEPVGLLATLNGWMEDIRAAD